MFLNTVMASEWVMPCRGVPFTARISSPATQHSLFNTNNFFKWWNSHFILLGLVEGIGGSPGDITEEPLTKEMQNKAWRMSCDVGEAIERLENEQSSAHSPTLLLLYLCHSLFSNPSVALSMSQLILQPFHCFTYVTAHSPTLSLLHLRHSLFSTPCFASPTSQALHLIHLASPPWNLEIEMGISIKTQGKNIEYYRCVFASLERQAP